MTDAWRPFEPCSENVAFAIWNRTMDRLLTPPWSAWIRRYLESHARAGNATRRTIYGTSEALERGTRIHREMEHRLRGITADQYIVDDVKSWPAELKVSGARDYVDLKET